MNLRQRFSDKVVLVTGSSRGIGLRIAQSFAVEGAEVVLNSAKTPVDGRLAARQICESGGKALYVQADMSKEEEIEALAQLMRSTFHRLDVLIHCAVLGRDASVISTSYPDFERTFKTTTYSLIALTRSLYPLMADKSKILYITSVGALKALPGYAIVGAAKAASEALVRSLSLELAPKVQVNAIRPFVLPTFSLHAFKHAEHFKKLAEESPSGLSSLDHLPGAALFLCSQEANFVTGQCLDIDGGWGTSVYRQWYIDE